MNSNKFNFYTVLQLALLSYGLFFSDASYSSCAPNVAPVTSCDALVVDKNISTPFSIGPTVIVDGVSIAFENKNTGSINTFINNGSIGLSTNTPKGVSNSGILSTFTNTGFIRGRIAVFNHTKVGTPQIGTLINTSNILGEISAAGTGIENFGHASIQNIQNSGAIVAGVAIKNVKSNGISGFIGTISNSGSAAIISAKYSHAIDNSGTIKIINNENKAVIDSPRSAIFNNGEIDQINNRSTMIGANSSAINNAGIISSITNSGFIYGGTNAIAIASGATIGTITNTALIGSVVSGLWGNGGIGISNSGTLTTLNNAQSILAYEGNLPAQYNVIIDSPNQYGKLSVIHPSGVTNFGIFQGSVIQSGTATYASVLEGPTVGNLVAITGTYGGGLVSVNWSLNNSSGTTWDLLTNTAVITSTPVVPKSKAGSSLATKIVSTYNAAVTTPTPPAPTPTPVTNPTLKNGVTFVAAVQSLTVPQVDQLISVHAEGYSSNMTINLEQMKTVANTVMDRIHNGISDRNANALSYKLDEGRYAWVDIAAFNGTVNSYNGLAGFGYNSYYGVVGVDLFRNQSGGLGIYAGAGNSQMTQSSQVSQSFNNNMGYVGMYGGLYLGRDIKLSGAIGYSFGQSKASRNNPNIGHFTGGVASDSYSSNGAFAAVKLSHNMLVGERFTLTPFVGGSYSQLNTSAVNELGGGDFNYSISAAKSYQTITFIGAEFAQPLKAGNNALSAIGFYRFSYNWSANTDAAHTVSATNSVFGTFNQTGANMGPISNLFGLGVQGQLSKNTSLRIGVVGSVNSNGYQYGGGGELRVRF